MSKPNIVNITTSQTFQNWFDKTNEMVDIMRDSVVTASVSGDVTIGNAAIQGELEANTIISNVDLKITSASAATNGQDIKVVSPVHITNPQAGPAAIFQYNATGGTTRYTTGTASWDIGYDNATDQNFVMNTGAGGQFKLSPGGVLTIPSLQVTTDIQFPTDTNGNVTGTLVVANAQVTDTLTANNAAFTNASGTFSGNFTGDIYHANTAGGNGSGKVLENGGPAATTPAVFYGNVNGTVSSISNHNTNLLKEGTDNRVGESTPGARDGTNNLYFTTARVHAALVGGTGVTIKANDGSINIGQKVGIADNVSFGDGSGDAITADGNIVATGDIEAAGAKISGTIVATGDITAFGTISDITMKENIVPIDNALEKVSQLGGYLFNYKGDDTPMTGVMAQELKDVLPGVVYETKDPATGKDIYAVRHGNIIGLLIEAIKELQEKVGK